METRVGGQSRQLYGKKSVEWDLNDWGWDGDLFLATPLKAAPSDCRSKQPFPTSNTSSSCSEEIDFGVGSVEAEKRRRVMVEEGGGPCDEAGSLTLKLGGQVYPVAEEDVANWEGRNGKRAKPHGGGSSRLTCQVEGCRADLSGAKDYHRRHKVCEMHAKASKAVVGNVMQRFCQQCSRFHLLQEFDEGKRSCRRRLAGHNRRRRKTHPEAAVTGNNMTSDQASSYLLITLLRILSNSHSTGLDQSKDQDLLPHLLKSIASLASSPDATNLSGLLQASQEMCKLGSAAGTSSEPANPSFSNGVAAHESSRPSCIPSKMTCITGKQGAPRPVDYSVSAAATRADMSSKKSVTEAPVGETTRAVPSQVPGTLISAADVLSTRSEALGSLRHMHAEPTVESIKLKGFDLNNTYNDAQDSVEVCEPVIHRVLDAGSNCPPWMLQDSHHSSPPQTSGNSDSVSTQSLSNSNGDAQNRTGRIVFKLFGKDPNDFPLSLRSQVLDWLSHSPTDMESYIRPGCIILTVYLRLPESAWQELCHDLSSSMNRLLSTLDDAFWRTGWVYAKVQHRIAFIYNGRVVLESPLLLKSPDHCNILSITPIAVSVSATVKFTVKGFRLARSTARLLCAFEGTHLVPETPPPLIEDTNNTRQHEGPQRCSFSCSVPNVVGRGFIEVEENGLSGDFFPFIVAEEDVCSEIRMLENIIDAAPYDGVFEGKSDIVCARNLSIDFLHEMGWLLHRSYLRSRSEKMKPQPNAFPLTRFKWLLSFAMDREWCAVVKKLLDILFLENIDSGECTPAELALSENLLHIAVRKNCKSMVELLLRYTPDAALEDTRADCFLFKPDMLSSSKITPLHIAASIVGAEGVLDALTDDPKQLGIKAWNSVRDSTGFTPEDYARSRGLISYMDLVQKKINRKLDRGHVVVDIPLLSLGANKQHDGPNPAKLNTFQIDKNKLMQQSSCRACDHQLLHRSSARRSMLYRPLMLSMVGIAAVCVCVGLLLKGPPEVLYIERPFRWETLSYGSS